MNKPYDCSADSKKKVDDFTTADQTFKAAWEDFENAHKAALEDLEKLREDRNVKLDEAVKALRAEAVELDITKVKWFKIGAFSIQKKWSAFYTADRFHSIVKDLGKLDDALADGALAIKIEVPYEPAKAWIAKNKLEATFAECEDGKEQTPAVTAPKPVAPLGAETKGK